MFTTFLLAAAAALPSATSRDVSTDLAAASAPIRVESLDTGFDPGRTGFTVTTPGGVDIDYREFTLFLRPGETFSLTASEPVAWEGEDLSMTPVWTAPDTPGHHHMTLTAADGAQMDLHLIVMRPRETADAEINGYRLGHYPVEPYRGLETYRAPEYFVEVSPGIEELPLSPHFRLGQFLCKQEGGGGPDYLVVSERLVLKLEQILEAANARGWRTDSFAVMSGYRTPDYNAGLGNGSYSRHIYGGAADIFIDTDGDGVMDDLNGDGRHDRADAAALYDLVEEMAAGGQDSWLAGGLGEYGPNAHHGAFVHVDERGFRARWGR